MHPSTVPVYGADLRRLINDDFAPDPHPEIVLLGGSLDARLRHYQKIRSRGSSAKRLFFALEGCERPAPGLTRFLPARDFFALTLSHRYTVGAVLTDMVRRELPLEIEREAERTVVRTYRDRYGGLLLPTTILEAIRVAAPAGNRATFLARLERVRMELLSTGVSLAAARERRDRIRSEGLGAFGLAAGLTALQTALLELFADVLLIQRGAMDDLLRCEAAAAAGGSSIAREYGKLDRANDYAWEALLGHVLRPQSVTEYIAVHGPADLTRAEGERPPYHGFGLLDPDSRRKAAEAPPIAAPSALIGPISPAARAKTLGDLSRPDGAEAMEPGTPTLDRLGSDLTARAAAGELPSVVGRDQEIQSIMEILCRRTKRNPVLVGPAGTGKTAIVTGLAHRIAAGLVPSSLAGSRVIEIQVASILAGTHSIGDIEDRVLPIIEEASRTRAILFFDEVHQLVGAGSYRSNDNDIVQIMKPALARGELAVIGATTAGEYRHYITGDSALERRLQVLEVREPTRDVTLAILRSVRDELVAESEIAISDEILPPLLRLADQALPGRSFPDKAIDLLENATASAVATGEGRVTAELVQASVSRMTRLPVDVDKRLDALSESMIEQGLMDREDVRALTRRLRVTLRGLGLNPARPRAVLAVSGDRGSVVAETLARVLFEDPERTFVADIGRVLTLDDLHDLLGGRQGHRSTSDSPIQRACRSPGSILVLHDLIEAAGPVQRIFIEALRTGRLSDSAGGAVRLGGTVVLLTAASWGGSSSRPIGFGGEGSSPGGFPGLAPELRDVIDVLADIPRIQHGPAILRRWAERIAVPRILALLQERDLDPPPPDELLKLVAEQVGQERSIAAVDRLVEETLLPRLLDPKGPSLRRGR